MNSAHVRYAIQYRGKLLNAEGEFVDRLDNWHDYEMMFETEAEAELNFPHDGCFTFPVRGR
jgi:hypothetical protein